MLCLKCKNELVSHPIYGILPCRTCNATEVSSRPTAQVEFTSDDIKDQRKAYKDDIMPDHRKGYLNRAWVDKYGTDAARKRGYSETEIKNCTYVYAGDDAKTDYYKE